MASRARPADSRRSSDMPAIYDITPPVTAATKVFPGDTPPTREVLLDMRRGDALTLSTLRSTVHLGAHVDAPSHYGRDARSMGAGGERHAIEDQPLFGAGDDVGAAQRLELPDHGVGQDGAQLGNLRVHQHAGAEVGQGERQAGQLGVTAEGLGDGGSLAHFGLGAGREGRGQQLVTGPADGGIRHVNVPAAMRTPPTRSTARCDRRFCGLMKKSTEFTKRKA